LDDIDSWTLDIYAEGNSEEEKQYLADSMRGLDDRTRYLATFDPGEIRRVYESADVLIVPSLWTENSPLVILYAMHTRTALVAADVDGVSKVVGDWGIYYPPNDAIALGKILRDLIADPEKRQPPVAPAVPHIDEHAAVVEKIYGE
jgi:glycosyltransferase involved in cell wall biosynthesis